MLGVSGADCSVYERERRRTLITRCMHRCCRTHQTSCNVIQCKRRGLLRKYRILCVTGKLPFGDALLSCHPAGMSITVSGISSILTMVIPVIPNHVLNTGVVGVVYEPKRRGSWNRADVVVFHNVVVQI